MSQQLIILLVSTLLITGCSQKKVDVPLAANEKSDCGEGTVVTSAAMGAVSGSVLGKITSVSIPATMILGSVAGSTYGNHLKELQCKYYNDERLLIQQILLSKQNHIKLMNQTNAINTKIRLLNEEMIILQQRQEEASIKQKNLLISIKDKQLEVNEIYKLNKTVNTNIKHYYQAVNSANYTMNDKDFLIKTLKHILESQTKIEERCHYNLQQLNEYEKSLQHV